MTQLNWQEEQLCGKWAMVTALWDILIFNTDIGKQENILSHFTLMANISPVNQS